jgi:soluble cytochrome b562
MRKKLLAMLAVSAFALGSASAFADLGEDMDTLAENLQVVQKTSDAGELKAALNKMRTRRWMRRKRRRRSWKVKRRTARK